MAPNKLEVESGSPEHTERLGRTIATLLPPGTVVALQGELATGKTCFVRGMAGHFAQEAPVHSPTFTLVNQYGDTDKLYHLDLYRLSGQEDLLDLGCEELFEPDGVCAVEWAERAASLLPAKRVDVLLEHVNETTRRITVIDRGILPAGWQETLAGA